MPLSYNDTVQYIFSLAHKSGSRELDEVFYLDKLLGYPSKEFVSIHVTGTNGKGSVSSKIAKSLELSGYKTALFSSPHIATFRERFQINSEYISEKEVVELTSKIVSIATKNGIHLTFFRIVVFIAFLYFKKQKVDIAVIEVGIGGLYDPTNIVTPLLSTITSISLDHTEMLGDTLDEIAFQKCGIIKDTVPVVIGPSCTQSAFKQIADKKNAKLIQVEKNETDYDLENQEIAKIALKAISDKYPVGEKAKAVGILKRPMCRYELITSQKVPIILDIAHNPKGIEKLFEKLNSDYPGKKITAIFGISSDKEVEKTISILSEKADMLVLTKSSWHKAIDEKVLKGYLDKSISVDLSKSIEEALEMAIEKSDENSLVVVCGTVYIMKGARKYLGLKDQEDPF